MIKKIVILAAVIVAFLSFLPGASAVEFGSNSANITNQYFPCNVGTWDMSLGFGNWTGMFAYSHTVGTDMVSGAQIGTQTLNNVKCLKINFIDTEDANLLSFWTAQDTQGNVWFLKVYSHTENTTFMLGTDFKSMVMPAVPQIGDPVGMTIPETETDYCRCVAVNVSLNTNFGSYNNCIKGHCFHESNTEVEYYCPGVGMARKSTVESPGNVMDQKEHGTAKVKQVVVVPLGD